MAATLGGDNTGARRFQIGRENSSKTGKAIFLEWLKELPTGDTKGRKFETRTSESGTVRHYEVFTAIDGKLTDIYVETRKIMDEERTMLYLKLDDGVDIQQVEIGDVDGRYSLNLLPRLLNPSIDFKKTIRVSPYAFEADGKTLIGVSVYNGVDKIERPEDGTFVAAQPEVSEFKGKKLYNFRPVFDALWVHIETSVKPKLTSLPPSIPAIEPQQKQDSGAFPTTDKTDYSEAPTPDDLPF